MTSRKRGTGILPVIRGLEARATFILIGILIGMLSLALTAGAALMGSAFAEPPSRAPVIVELFTSEGCSSCPPADRLLMELEAKKPVAGVEVIPLALHVDYWNHLGWTDPFSSAQFSARQRQYASAFGSSRLYTPQMIVDGVSEFVGSDAKKAAAEIAAAAKARKAVVRLEIDRGEPTGNPNRLPLDVHLSGIESSEPFEVWLASTESGLKTAVARGENAGRSLEHCGVARELRLLATLDPKANPEFSIRPTIDLKPEWNRARLRAVVFLQETKSRRIIGAASLSLGE